MRHDFHVQQSKGGCWVVLRQGSVPLAVFRRQSVAEAYGRALAHRAKVSLIVRDRNDRSVRYSAAQLTYSRLI